MAGFSDGCSGVDGDTGLWVCFTEEEIMAVYEYKCPSGHKQERDRPMSQSKDDTLCSECGQVARRIMSLFGFTFGWRLTDSSHERFADDQWERDV